MGLIDRQFVFEIARLVWGTSLTKVGGAIAGLGAASAFGFIQYVVVALFGAFGVTVTVPEAPLWFSLALVLLGLMVATLGGFWQRQRVTAVAGQHDIELYQRFKGLISEVELQFLREQDFGNPFAYRWISGVLELGQQWKGARFEFADDEVEQLFIEVKAKARAFTDAVAQHVHGSIGNPDWATTKPNHFDGDYPDWLLAANKKLNERATVLTQAIDEFERLASVRAKA